MVILSRSCTEYHITLIADGFHSNFTAKEFPRFLPVRMLASLDL
jgi:hypothetical protein